MVGVSQTWEALARAERLSVEDPARLREVLVALVVHGLLAVGLALGVRIAHQRFGRRLSWRGAALVSTPVFVVLAFEVVEHAASGEGGLRALSWLIAMVVATPAALFFGWLTTWWIVGFAGLSSSTWCGMMALVYVPLIANYGLSHW